VLGVCARGEVRIVLQGEGSKRADEVTGPVELEKGDVARKWEGEKRKEKNSMIEERGGSPLVYFPVYP